MLKPKPATYADILALPEHLNGEIIDGELIVSPRPAPAHALAAAEMIASLLPPFTVREGNGDRPGGWRIVFEPELHLGRDVLIPDLAGWRRARMPTLPKTAWFELAPDWVCEVISPSSGRRDRVLKAPRYLAAGVDWLWLVEPAQKIVEVLQRVENRWVLAGNWGGSELDARIPPFDAVPLDMSRWWEDEAEGVSDVEIAASPDQ